MKNSKKGNLPLHHGIKTSKDLCLKTDEELDKMSRVPYDLAIGSIIYVMKCTRPNVSFALSMVSRHQQNPGKGHWIAIKNILKYLRNTKDMFLVYGGEEELRVTGYCDASWQTDKDDSRSQSDLGVVLIVHDPIEILCDNESVVALTKEPKDHGKSKHIERKYHFVRRKVEEGHVIVKDIRSEDNPADPFIMNPLPEYLVYSNIPSHSYYRKTLTKLVHDSVQCGDVGLLMSKFITNKEDRYEWNRGEEDIMESKKKIDLMESEEEEDIMESEEEDIMESEEEEDIME
ncbi:hypothetical protein Tco_0389466 [Tanacetum coccineum]